jgi:type II secretory pathway pseudopilin PulG
MVSMAYSLPLGPALKRGFSYVEVLVSIVLMAALLTPATQALQAGIAAGATHKSTAANQQLLRAKMEEVLAKPFSSLYAETYLTGGNTTTSISAAFSDPVGPNRRTVILYRFDGSALSSSDTGLLWVQVAYEGTNQTLTALTGKWW